MPKTSTQRTTSTTIIFGLIGLVASLLTILQPASAEAEGTPGGVFVPVTAFRAGSNAQAAGSTANYKVTGVGGIPATGVGGVVVDIAVGSTSATSSSYLTAFTKGTTRPVVQTMFYTSANASRSNTAIIKPSADGYVSVFNYLGNSNVYVDVQGYFKESDSGNPGGFVTVTPTRIANTETGTGLSIPGKIGVNGVRTIQVTGDQIPADATAVFANVEVRNATEDGAVVAGPGAVSLASRPATVNYSSGGPNSSGVAIALSPSGAMRIENVIGSAVDARIDIQGYFTSQSGGGVFQALTPATAASATGVSSLAGGETRRIVLGGKAGIPATDNVGAVAMTVHARNWSANGSVIVFAGDDETAPNTANLTFHANEGVPTNGTSTSAIVPVGEDGSVQITNTSSAKVDVTLVSQGWFTAPEFGDRQPSTTPTTGLLNISGSLLDNGASINGGEVMISAWPRGPYLDAQTEGATVPMWKMGTVETSSSGSFQLTYPTSSLPPEFIQDGVVNLEILGASDGLAIPYQVSVTPAAPASATPSAFNLSSLTPVEEGGAVVELDLGNGATKDLNDPEGDWDSDVEDETSATPTFFQAASVPTVFAQIDSSGTAIPEGVLEDVPGLQAQRSESLAIAHARAQALIEDQTGATPPAASLENVEESQGDALQATFTPGALRREDGGVCVTQAKEKKLGQSEKFGSIYNWDGAKATWKQTTTTKHILGVAVKTPGGNYAAKGTASLKYSGAQTDSMTMTKVVDKTAWNKVNYRRYLETCTGKTTWKPIAFHTFFTKTAPSVDKAWKHACTNYPAGTKFTRQTQTAYTKDGGVTLAGVIALNAQSGYNKGTWWAFNITKKSRLCGTNDDGLLQSRGVLAKKP